MQKVLAQQQDMQHMQKAIQQEQQVIILMPKVILVMLIQNAHMRKIHILLRVQKRKRQLGNIMFKQVIML